MAAAPAVQIAPKFIAPAESHVHFGDRPPGIRSEPPVANARLALLLFMATETMLFAGLMGIFVVFRIGSRTWPPPGQPYLPIAITWINTAILMASGWTMWRAAAANRRGTGTHIGTDLLATLALGSLFLAMQGFEWVRLIHHGLTLSSSVYGGTFYILIGLHALHVIGAVVWLAVVMRGVSRGRYVSASSQAVGLCGMYWGYVCALWLVLFWLVYLM
jgi:cytochrome c oxidase subunit 3